MKAERIPDHAVERAMEWSKAQEETFHVKFPDREAGEPAASPEQLHAIHELVRSISGSDLAHLGTKQAAYLIDEITHEKARFTERKVHEYLDRQTRSSSTGCLLLFLLLAGIVYVMIHSAH